MLEIISYGHAYVLDDIGWFSGEESFTSWTRKGRSCSCKVFFFHICSCKVLFSDQSHKIIMKCSMFWKMNIQASMHWAFLFVSGRWQRTASSWGWLCRPKRWGGFRPPSMPRFLPEICQSWYTTTALFEHVKSPKVQSQRDDGISDQHQCPG